MSGVAWHGDGFFYSRYPPPPPGQERASINENHQVFFHRIGTPQSQDRLVYEDAANPQRFHTLQTTEDERFAILIDFGARQGQVMAMRSMSAISRRGRRASRRSLPTIADDSFGVIDNVGERLLVQTNCRAPNWRVVLVDPAHPEEGRWTDVLPERPAAAARRRSRPAASCSRRISRM